MRKRDLQRQALELVIEYRRQSVAAREVLSPCEHESPAEYDEWSSGLISDGESCYRSFKNDTAHQGEFRPPTEGEMEDWCEACRGNESVFRRKREGAKAKGVVLRRIHALAKKAGEP